MKKVLVAVDGSDKSLEAADYAMSIANKEHAQLIILNVLDTEPWFYGQSAYGWATEDVLRKVYAHQIPVVWLLILSRSVLLYRTRKSDLIVLDVQSNRNNVDTSCRGSIQNHCKKNQGSSGRPHRRNKDSSRLKN